jgi:FixJ family two-component response regulator
MSTPPGGAGESCYIQARYHTLTAREQEVMQLLIESLPIKLIGIGISAGAAEHHRDAVLRRMQARTSLTSSGCRSRRPRGRNLA